MAVAIVTGTAITYTNCWLTLRTGATKTKWIVILRRARSCAGDKYQFPLQTEGAGDVWSNHRAACSLRVTQPYTSMWCTHLLSHWGRRWGTSVLSYGTSKSSFIMPCTNSSSRCSEKIHSAWYRKGPCVGTEGLIIWEGIIKTELSIPETRQRPTEDMTAQSNSAEV